MKTTKNLCLAILALSLVGTPVLAQKSRSNKGGQDAGNVGDERAAQVHALNQSKKNLNDSKNKKNLNQSKKKGDRDSAASTNKTKGMHKAIGHRH